MASLILGCAILVAIMGGLFLFTCFAGGIRLAIFVWGGALVLTFMVCLGVFLLTNGIDQLQVIGK